LRVWEAWRLGGEVVAAGAGDARGLCVFREESLW
jgi:hypothetical protein